MSKLCRIGQFNDHDYDSLSLEVAHAGTEKYAVHGIYALHISPNSAYFASKSFAYFRKILR